MRWPWHGVNPLCQISIDHYCKRKKGVQFSGNDDRVINLLFSTLIKYYRNVWNRMLCTNKKGLFCSLKVCTFGQITLYARHGEISVKYIPALCSAARLHTFPTPVLPGKLLDDTHLPGGLLVFLVVWVCM